MLASPLLVEAAELITATLVGSGIAASIGSALKRIVSAKEHTVALKFPNGNEVRLELDKSLSEEKVNALISQAISSAQSGSEAAIQQTVEDSRTASQEAREIAATN